MVRQPDHLKNSIPLTEVRQASAHTHLKTEGLRKIPPRSAKIRWTPSECTKIHRNPSRSPFRSLRARSQISQTPADFADIRGCHPKFRGHPQVPPRSRQNAHEMPKAVSTPKRLVRVLKVEWGRVQQKGRVDKASWPNQNHQFSPCLMGCTQ